MTQLSRQDHVWNRAALEAGGPSPADGDVALASLLLAHGAIMNGGMDHALDFLSPLEIAAAVSGFRYFLLPEAAAILEQAPGGNEDQLEQLNSQYGRIVPRDDTLVHAFRLKLLSNPKAFAPVADA